MGDEGSGAYLGKKLLKDFLYRKMPPDVAEKLKYQYKMDKEKILNIIYKQPNPNRWLASFSYFIRDNLNSEYCNELVRQSFREFFDVHVSAYSKFKDLPLGAVGSISYYYRDFLEEVSKEYGFNLSKVIKSPVAELPQYYKELENVTE